MYGGRGDLLHLREALSEGLSIVIIINFIDGVLASMLAKRLP